MATQTSSVALSSPLRSTKEQLRLFGESVEDYAIFLLDRDGRVASWNRGAERIKGYRAEEIIGQSFAVFYPPEDVARGKPAEALALAERDGRVEYKGWRVRKDGTRFWANVVITALRDSSGVLEGFGKVTRDLTSRSERLRQAAHHAIVQALAR